MPGQRLASAIYPRISLPGPPARASKQEIPLLTNVGAETGKANIFCTNYVHYVMPKKVRFPFCLRGIVRLPPKQVRKKMEVVRLDY